MTNREDRAAERIVEFALKEKSHPTWWTYNIARIIRDECGREADVEFAAFKNSCSIQKRALESIRTILGWENMPPIESIERQLCEQRRQLAALSKVRELCEAIKVSDGKHSASFNIGRIDAAFKVLAILNERRERMTNREIDYAIAERLFGWKWHHGLDDGRYSMLCSPSYFEEWSRKFGPSDEKQAGGGRMDASCPHYTSDPAADYAVLVKVRDEWGESPYFEFLDEVNDIWRERATDEAGRPLNVEPWATYVPGDYSNAARAALAAMGIDTTREGE